MCVLLVLLASAALVAGKPQNERLAAQDQTQTLSRFICPPENGLYMDDYQCDLYYECENGVATEKLCDDGLVFDDEKAAAGHVDPCDTPYIVDCFDRTELQPPTNPSYGCPRRHGIFPHPDVHNCVDYYICRDGLPTRNAVSTCTPGLHFNPTTGNCEWPQSAGRTGCDAEILNCIGQPDTDGYFCCNGTEVFDEHGQAHPHPTYANYNDCQKFWVCLNKVTPQESSCNAGKVYNDKTNLCDWPENVPDCHGWYRDDPQYAHYYEYYEEETQTPAEDVGAQDTPV